MVMPLKRGSAGMAPASYWACARGCSEPLRTDISEPETWVWMRPVLEPNATETPSLTEGLAEVNCVQLGRDVTACAITPGPKQLPKRATSHMANVRRVTQRLKTRKD